MGGLDIQGVRVKELGPRMGLIDVAVEEIRRLSLRAFVSCPVMIERWMRGGAKRSGWHELLQLTSVNYCVHVSQSNIVQICRMSMEPGGVWVAEKVSHFRGALDYWSVSKANTMDSLARA